MRSVAAHLLLLVLATGAAAQTITYGPFEPGARDRSFAVGVAPHGLLFTWSEIDRGSHLALIHTALYDFDGNLAGPIHTLPAITRNAHAASPVIATDGTGFFIGWIERNRYSDVPVQVAGALVDGEGQLIGESHSYGQPMAGASSLNLIWDGLTYRLYGGETYYIAPDGNAVRRGFIEQRVPFATPDANGWIEWRSEPRRTSCPFFLCGGFPAVTPAAYTLDWAIVTRDWIRTGTHRETNYEAVAPVVVAHDDDLLVVWGSPIGLRALRIEDGEEKNTFGLTEEKNVLPFISESLVVFEREFSIYGTVITGDQFGPVFPISDGEEFDTTPRAYLVGENRYLVTFAREGDGRDISLVARFVTVSP